MSDEEEFIHEWRQIQAAQERMERHEVKPLSEQCDFMQMMKAREDALYCAPPPLRPVWDEADWAAWEKELKGPPV